MMAGTMLGPYRIIDALRTGDSGEVYRARDDRLQRDVALKLIPAARAEDDGSRARCLREAQAAVALDHPHIGSVYAVGEAEGRTYIAMELVEGRTLDQVIPAGGLDIAAALDLGAQLAGAVAHAHAHGVLHRDLRTSNVMVTTDGRVKVLDFGLAGRDGGAISYMAPEQMGGQDATAATDVWSIGTVLHEMITGERPFSGSTDLEIAAAIRERPPRVLPHTVPTILRGVISRCLAKEPSHRYEDARELAAVLDAIRGASSFGTRR